MEPKSVIISGEKFAEKNVRQFLADAEKLTGATITITPQWVITCDSPDVSMALAALFGGFSVAGTEPVDAKLTGKGKRATKALKKNQEAESLTQVEPPEPKKFELRPAPPQELKAWEVYLPGQPEYIEKITVTERNLRLTRGDFETGTVLRHPKGGWVKVTGDKGNRGQGMADIDADEAEKLIGKV
jgi:hypothetical protein